MKNWRTSLLGAIAGIPQLVKGIILHDPVMITTGATTILLGWNAKDYQITGVGL